MIQIFINKNNFFKEKQYIIETIFSFFWGLDFQLSHHELDETRIVVNQIHVKIPDVLFAVNKDDWLSQKSLPEDECQDWDCTDEHFADKLVSPYLPVFYSVKESEHYIAYQKNEIVFNFDLLGACFFMLSGYEEYVKKERDQHDRFSHTVSHAYQNHYLERPLVNEYLEVLWHCLTQLVPLTRLNRHFQFQVSHDVDAPFRYAFSGYENVLKESARSLLNFDVYNALRQPLNYYRVKQEGKVQRDPYYTFPFLMKLAEKYNIELVFYFIAENTHPMNANYDLSHQLMTSLLSYIHTQGHKVGLHGSYLTYRDGLQFGSEFKKLRKVCESLNIIQSEWGNRQHFLRWHNPETVEILSQNDISHDSTCGFPGHVGFKAGVCYEFPLFDLKSQKKTSVIERPLIAMEATLLGYMNLNYDAALERVVALATICKRYNGQFSLLWHNSNLNQRRLRQLYQQIFLEVA